MERRKFLQQGALSAAAVAALPITSAAEPNAKPSIRVAFISDVHVKTGEIPERGMQQAFKHVNALKPSVDFIINGGDAIMDAMKATKAKTQEQWDLWNKILNAENKLPIYHCIGNHDAWGWQMTEPEIKNDPLYNKAWAVKQHQMPGRFYSFTHKNWKFIILDSAHENNGGYIAKIDEEQWIWLENELKNTDADTHICIASHIPIVSYVSGFFFDKTEDNGDRKISRALLHTDSFKLTELFRNFKNIRCCLSGHIHLQDMVEYRGIHYYCNGAISGNWWGGAFKGFAPAYAIFEFFKDGTLSRKMVEYS
ncbi:MAG: metallophosphoesterase family protein [Sediminibacterium sp.]